MRKTGVMVALACSFLFAASREANAQDEAWLDRAYLNVGFGVEWGESNLNDAKTFTIYDEAASVKTSSHWTSGSLFDGGAGIRIWKGLTLGGAYHQESNTADVKIEGSIPSPVFFNRPRSFTATEAGLVRKEHAAHVQIGWLIPFGEKFDLMVFGGPSFFRFEQDVVSDVVVGEKGSPFTDVVVQGKTLTRKESVVGYNGGFDATYIVWSNDSVRLGAGAFVRYTLAKGKVFLLTSEQPTDIGGVEFGFGARLRF